MFVVVGREIEIQLSKTEKVGDALILKELETLGDKKIRAVVEENLTKIKQGERDFRF